MTHQSDAVIISGKPPTFSVTTMRITSGIEVNGEHYQHILTLNKNKRQQENCENIIVSLFVNIVFLY